MEYMMCIIYCICPYCRSSQQLRHLMQSQVSVEDSFQVLLLGRHRSRLSVLPHEFLAVFQRSRAVGQFLTETELERAVSLSQILGEDSILDESSGVAQTASEGVHSADVSDEQILSIRRFPAQFSVEVQTAGLHAVLLGHRKQLRIRYKTWIQNISRNPSKCHINLT